MNRCEYPYEVFIQKCVLKHLKNSNYGKVVVDRGAQEHGVDIKVRNDNYSRYWLVEVKGGSNSPNARSVETNNFVFGLGQIITRVQSITETKAAAGSNKYGVAYPYDFIRFLRRKRLHWNLCKNLNLYIFLVHKDGSVEEYSWKRIKEEFY